MNLHYIHYITLFNRHRTACGASNITTKTLVRLGYKFIYSSVRVQIQAERCLSSRTLVSTRSASTESSGITTPCSQIISLFSLAAKNKAFSLGPQMPRYNSLTNFLLKFLLKICIVQLLADFYIMRLDVHS